MLKNNNGAVITKMALRSLKNNRRRNGIMVFAVMLSAFMLFTTLTVGVTWFHMQDVQNLRMKGGDFDAVLYGGFNEKQKNICEKNAGIRRVGMNGIAGWSVSTERDSTLHSGLIWSDEVYWEQMMKPARTKMEGRYPEKSNELMATKKALEDCGMEDLGVGDRFILTYADNKGEHTREFIISGMWDGYGDQQAFYVSQSFFEESGFTLEDTGRGLLYLKFKSRIVTGEAQKELEDSLELNKKQRLLFTSETASSVQMLVGVLGLVAVTCISAYLLIYNIMYLSVSGNIRYYGLLRTVGMTGRQIHQFVIRQMCFLGGMGIAAGLILGTVMSFQIIPRVVKILGIRQNDIQISFHPGIFLLSVLMVGITVWLGSRKPARMATAVSPMEALGHRVLEGKKESHKAGRGNLLWRMAGERVIRDKKKAVLVMAALGICLSFFLCMVTLIQSQGARTLVSGWMESDLLINNDTMQMEEQSKWKPLLDQELLGKIREDKAVKEVHSQTGVQVVIPWEEDFMEYWMTEFYDMWMAEEYEDVREDYQKHPDKYYSFLIGIDQTEFEQLNDTLENSLNWEDFARGKECVLYQNDLDVKKERTIGKKISFYRYGDEGKSYQMTIGGMINDRYYANMLGTAPTLIVSDTYLESIVKNPYVLKAAILYEEEYDEQVEGRILELLKSSPYHKDFSYNSKIEAMEDVKKAQGNMMGIGIGITCVLALISIVNYVNTSVGNIQSSQVELAIMESIGMSKKQVKKLLIREGILFACGSLLLMLSLGMGVTYYLYQSMNYQGVSFVVPLLPMLGAVVVILAICVMVPLIAYGSVEKQGSIVERIRRFE